MCVVSVSHTYAYYMHSCVYPEMACIRLGENAGVMDLASYDCRRPEWLPFVYNVSAPEGLRHH